MSVFPNLVIYCLMKASFSVFLVLFWGSEIPAIDVHFCLRGEKNIQNQVHVWMVE